MRGRTDPVVVWGRAALLAAVTVFLGTAGHVTAGGLMPHPAVALGLLVLGVPAAAMFLRGPASTLRLVVLLVGGQGLAHAVLSWTGGHVGDRSVATPPAPLPPSVPQLGAVDGRRVGSLNDAYQAALGTTPHHVSGSRTDPVAALVTHVLEHGPMMAAHALAAALVALWLAVGERALWALIAYADAAVVRPLRVAWGLARTGAAPDWSPLPSMLTPAWAHTSGRLARTVSRRGPPALLA